jgi:hypothetical protein
VHRAPPDHDSPDTPSAHEKSRLLAQSDPQPYASTTRNRRATLLVIIVVLLVTAVVLLHLSGVVGPASH